MKKLLTALFIISCAAAFNAYAVDTNADNGNTIATDATAGGTTDNGMNPNMNAPGMTDGSNTLSVPSDASPNAMDSASNEDVDSTGSDNADTPDND